MKKLAALVLLVVFSSGCYHATVDTGIRPGVARTETISASSWIYGLVPPKEVNATERCGGQPASSVETQVSFVNGLVQYLTLGIHSPMTISITCGSPTGSQE